jgi:hypothetical protein
MNESSESHRLNTVVFNNIILSLQENLIIKSLEKFYSNNININKFIPIVNSKSKISIRLIDHFITKYCKKNKISYKLLENNNDTQFNVFISYKQQLKAFKKKYFDPFSRGDRIPYFIGNTCVITTIGQLNFFKWFISKKIYDYIIDIQEDIENDMNKKNKHDKIKQKKINKEYKKNSIIKLSRIPTTTNVNFNNSILQCTNKDNILVTFSF